MGKLFIGPEGFVDLRSNPPAEKDRVNGWTPGEPEPVKETVPVEFPPEPVEKIPGRQVTTEGLDRPVAPVKVEKAEKATSLKRIVAVNDANCYAIVTPTQFEKFGKFEWTGNRSGKLYRMGVRKGIQQAIWLHRECATCFRVDRYVGFRNGDERLLAPSNLKVFASKKKANELKLAARRQSTGK